MSNDHAAGRPAMGHQIGLFLVSCATLLLQITWTRVLSVSLWYHFAFLVVSTAMLGLGLSGVLLTVSKRLARIDLDRGLVLFSGAQVVTTIVGFALAERIPFAPFAMLAEPIQLLYAPLYLLAIATPFVCSGLTAALLLSRCSTHAGRIYCFDLLGAACGCFLIAVVMPAAGGSGAVTISAALAAAGTLAFAVSAGNGRARVVAVVALLLLAMATPWANSLLPVRISHTKKYGELPMDQALRSERNLYTGWNTSSRIDVLPARWGRAVLIDAGTAMTRIPRVNRAPREVGPIGDERRIVLKPGEQQSVLIIGSGGGWEVLAALSTGAKRIVAVEVNPLINALVTGPMAAFVGHIFSDPSVELHAAEARSFIRRSDRRFDAILASHTISNAATASGALSLSEEYILTREAFADYLDHLTPRGRLWFSRPMAQLPRLVATAREALAARGVATPAKHLIVFSRGPFYGGLVVARQPISRAETNRAGFLLARTRTTVLHLPVGPRSYGIYRTLLSATPDELERLYREHPTQLRPATDDRPFFNQRTRWSSLGLGTVKQVFDQPERGRMALEDQPVAEVVLLVVLVQSTLLALALVLAPLWWRKRAALRGQGPLLSYFLLLGVGFIVTEIVLIQRFTLFVGRPVHTFAVVVGALLLSSGVGSLLSERLMPGSGDRLVGRLRLVLLAIFAVLLLSNLALPPILAAALGLPFAARVALAVALVAPIGLLLGIPFPVGIRYAGEHAPGIVPWAWGLNAVASVVGSVAAMIVATGIGFSGSMTAASLTYLLAALLWLRR